MRTKAKQERIREYILRKIHSGMREGDLLPTVSELVKELGVSPMTIHKALNGLVTEGVLYKIQGKGTFVGKNAIHSLDPDQLRIRAKKTIAFVSPYLHDDIFMKDFTLGVMEGIDHDNYSLITKHVWIPMMKEEEVIAEAVQQADGMILLSHLTPPVKELLGSVLTGSFPIVFLDHYPLNMPCSSVCADNEDGARIAMEYLYSLGHHGILFVTSENGCSSEIERLNGYRRFMGKYSLSPRVVLTGSGLKKELQRVFKSRVKHDVSAIFTLHDGIAIEVAEILAGLGLRIPEDVSVVGFNDDIGVADLPVPLTTVAQPKRRIGTRAAQLIQDMLSGKVDEPVKYFFPGNLVIRQSTQAVSKQHYQQVV